MKIYTATWCKPCNELKAWIKEHNVNDVPITFVDIDTEQHVIKADGVPLNTVPALLYQGLFIDVSGALYQVLRHEFKGNEE